MKTLNKYILVVCSLLVAVNALTSCNRLEVIGTPANLDFSCSQIDFGQVSTAGDSDITCTVHNSGETAASNFRFAALASPFRAVDASEVTGTPQVCLTDIKAGDTCRLIIEFKPTSVGVYSLNPFIIYNDGTKNITVNFVFSGEGIVPPEADVIFQAGNSYDFGNLLLGSSASQIFTIENQGDAPATALAAMPLVSHFRFTGGAYPGLNGTCSNTLAVTDTCDLEIEFAPGISGSLNGTFTLQFNNGVTTTTESLSLTGTASAPTEAFLGIVSGVLYNMGTDDITKTLSATLTLQNSGGMNATSLFAHGLASPFQFQGGSYPGTGGTCAGSLNVGATCTLVIDFVSATPGVFNDVLNIDYYNGAANESMTLSLIATATAFDPGTLTFTQASPFDFGQVDIGDTATALLDITNTGELSVTSLTASTSSPFQFSGGTYPGTNGTCGTNLSPSAACIIEIAYSPTVYGTFSRTLTLNFNNGVSATSKIFTLQGSTPPGGGFDPSFGTQGVVELDFSTNDNARALSIKTNGKILVGGDESGPSTDEDFAMFQLETNGDLDTTFATAGHLIQDLGSGSSDVVANMVEQSDGKIVLSGTRDNKIATVRYSANGITDNTFDPLGLSGILIPLLSSAGAYSSAIDPNGKILVVGEGFPSSGDTQSFALRMGSGGLIDLLNFGLTGIRTFDLSSSGNESMNVVRHDANNRPVIGGYREVASVAQAMIARLGTSGGLDNTFASGGVFSASFCGSGQPSEVLSSAIQSDGKIVAVGRCGTGSSGDMLAFRLLSNGGLDTSFGTGGVTQLDIAGEEDQAKAVALDSSSRIVIAGDYEEGPDKGIALVRLNTNGTADPTFGTAGVQKILTGSEDCWANDLKIQPDGKIVIGGTKESFTGTNYVVFRRLP